MIASLALNRRRAALPLLFALLFSLVSVTGPASAAVEWRSVVVQASDDLGRAVEAIVQAGGVVKTQLELIGGAVAHVPAAGLARLTADRRVRSVTPNYALEVQSSKFSAEDLVSSFPASVGATEMWAEGITGKGVGVALLDTGVADHPDLAGRVVASADLTREGTFSDSYGHGTFLAGLIAGDGAASEGRYAGVAPGAHLMSVKVAGADGATTLGQVLYGLQLIDSSKERYGIKVVAIALAGPAQPGPDPLEIAVERLWADGLTVVVAAGNDGPAEGTLASPGIDPYVITVGGTNDRGTPDRSDDVVADWSARGPTPDGLTKPDLVAPGASVVSLKAAGSTIATEAPSAQVEEAYFRGSGTSMATGVAAGAAALLLEAEPGLSPDQVKGRLMGSADPVAGADPNAAGRGMLDVAAAAESDAPAANQDLPALPGGAVQAPRDPGGSGGQSFDWFKSPVGGDRWLGKSWAGKSWAGKSWAGKSWAGKSWANAEWSGKSWADSDWAGKSWAGKSWAGKSWAGKSWAGKSWAGNSWAGKSWAGKSWAGKSWAGKSWASVDWR